MQASALFIDAFSSDDKLHIVRDMIQNRNLLDVDRFYVRVDGTETC